MKLWKIQKFFGDVVYDLRQRGLLPIVVLLLVGMVAVPFLIGGGGSTSSTSATESVVNSAAELAPENQKAVVAYQPGVRDYKERLKNLTAKDPFKQQFVQAAAAASQLSTSVGASTTSTSVGTTGGGTTGSDTTSDTGSEGTGEVGGQVPDTGGSSGKGGGGSTKTRTRYIYYTSDLEVGEAAWTLQRRNGVKALTPLPSETVPVAIYLGATVNGKQALFLLSDQVTQVMGPGQCLPSPTDCSMLALKPGQSQDMVYGADGKTYRIKLVRNRRIISSKPPQ